LAYQGLSILTAQLLSGAVMTHKTSRQRRSKTLVALLLPALILIGIMGLFLYLTGNEYSYASKKVPHGLRQSDGLTFVPAVYEEHVEIISK